jgi:hypothetical protein
MLMLSLVLTEQTATDDLRAVMSGVNQKQLVLFEVLPLLPPQVPEVQQSVLHCMLLLHHTCSAQLQACREHSIERMYDQFRRVCLLMILLYSALLQCAVSVCLITNHRCTRTCALLHYTQPQEHTDNHCLVQVYSYDAAVLEALEAATAKHPLYQKARKACVHAILAATTATSPTTTGAGASSKQQVVPVTESVYAKLDPSDFKDVLNW